MASAAKCLDPQPTNMQVLEFLGRPPWHIKSFKTHIFLTLLNLAIKMHIVHFNSTTCKAHGSPASCAQVQIHDSISLVTNKISLLKKVLVSFNTSSKRWNSEHFTKVVNVKTCSRIDEILYHTHYTPSKAFWTMLKHPLTPCTLNLCTIWSPSSAEPRQWAPLLDINPDGWEALYAMMLLRSKVNKELTKVEEEIKGEREKLESDIVNWCYKIKWWW